MGRGEPGGLSRRDHSTKSEIVSSSRAEDGRSSYREASSPRNPVRLGAGQASDPTALGLASASLPDEFLPAKAQEHVQDPGTADGASNQTGGPGRSELVTSGSSLEISAPRKSPTNRKDKCEPLNLGGSPESAPSGSPIRSHHPPRIRDRGMFLRRPLLGLNFHWKTKRNRSSVMELQEAGNKTGQADSENKKSTASLIVSPVSVPNDSMNQSVESSHQWRHRSSDYRVEKRLPLSSAKKDYVSRSSTLPNYETWAQSTASRFKIVHRLREFKEHLRKTILGLHPVRSSECGRHIEMDLGQRRPLHDERRGCEYIKNIIRSCRYTPWNFLPRQIYAQFSKLANFYFLCVSILQMIPGLSTTGTYTTIVPLLFFVTISMAKEGYEDLRRYKLDKAENRKSAKVLNAFRLNDPRPNTISNTTSNLDGPRVWDEIKWQDVRVGDVVRLVRDEAVPADLVLLKATGAEDTAYIETMALDGETNLKCKQPSPLLRGTFSTSDVPRCHVHVVVEDPNLDLYNFEGKITVNEETLPLTNNEIIYRGSVLRNTLDAVGMVIYTGEECKIRMNATKSPRVKSPALQSVVNKVVIIIVIFVIALAIFNTVAYQFWQETTEESAWYLTNARVAFFPILTSFIILFNTLIPLSLYVSLEIVKLFQIFLLHDIEMYDEHSNIPMEARTSTINEELGQVNYIFSDKTGTLTDNSMRFRKISIAGTAWLHDLDVQEKITRNASRPSLAQPESGKGKKLMTKGSTTSNAIPKSSFPPSPCHDTSLPNSPTCSNHPARATGSHQLQSTHELLRYIQRRPHTLFAQKVRTFLLSIALCHTCFPETNRFGDVDYQAASPDEQALVRAAKELGYIVVDRQNAVITIKSLPSGHENKPSFDAYRILDVIEFSSARRRMSIIVRLPDERICLFSKGADSAIMQRLRLSSLAMQKAIQVEQRVYTRQSMEAQEVMRRASEAQSRKNSIARTSLSIHRHSIGGTGRASMSTKRLQPIRDEVDHWLKDREDEFTKSPIDKESILYSPRPSVQMGLRNPHPSIDGKTPILDEDDQELVEEDLVADSAAVFERCFQHINDFATDGLRTLLYGHRFLDEEEYKAWKKLFLDASTSLVNRQEKIDKAGAMVEHDLELGGATAIEDKLQEGVPETIDKLRRANIKLWMLTGDKRETAINVGHSCRLIKDYSTITVLDCEGDADVSQTMAAATLDISNGLVAHSVIVIDGATLSQVNANDALRKLFLSLTIGVDTVICCRASPSQKASLVHSIRSKVKNAVTLAIGDGANDIAMIQEAHVGIGITGKEGLQASRTSDYSIAQFRFLAKLLLVHGRWNYIRICKYTLGTFWKEMFFYLTQALFQRMNGYTATSLFESWSLSMFNTLFTSLPVIFMGIFEQDLSAPTLMAVPELYQSLGPINAGFNIPLYLSWVAMAVSQAAIVFFLMLGLYGQALFTLDNGLFAMGDLTFTACVIVIVAKIQFWELHNKTYTCVVAMFLSIGGWFLWNLILSSVYSNNVIYNVKDGFMQRFGRNALWWLTLFLVITACWVLEIIVKTIKCTWMPSDADCFRELEKDPAIRARFEQAAGAVGGSSYDQADPYRIQHVRTAEEDRQREGEVQEILDRPRQMRSTSGSDEQEHVNGASVRRRQLSEPEAKASATKVSFAVEQKELESEDNKGDEEYANGKAKALGSRSTDVQELLKRGFGSVRRSLDIG